MKSLLYKDFLMIKGKTICIFIVCFLIVFICLRIAFPGTNEAVIMTSYASDENNMLVKENLSMDSLVDIFLTIIGTSVSMCLMFVLPNSVPQFIGRGEEDRNYRKYMNGMPISKKDMIAEKYVFAGILTFASYNITLLIMMILNASCVDQIALHIISVVNSLAPVMASYALLTCAFTFPFTYKYGTGIAVKIQNGILAFIVVAVIGYLCFADWNLFRMIFLSENGELLEYIASKQEKTIMFQILSPAIVLLIYYVSYRVTLIIGMKEYGND